METKKEIRKRIRKERSSLAKDTCRTESRKVCNRLLKEPWYQKTQNILVYRSANNEVCLDEFIRCAWKDGKNLYFPKVNGDKMEFYKAASFEDFEIGSFDMKEPKGSHIFDTKETKAVMIVPGVAFSETGQRIGYGKGFYDRYLTGRKERIYRIGAAYEMQLLRDWEQDPCDIRMNAVITEKRKVEIYDEA